ncbi:hypothetical protein BSKO_05947 [Bryopsis sp. KO-2023]|nr:hypothetical protein BSKO_05947 [Bryopsis sp. KO-2023]
MRRPGGDRSRSSFDAGYFEGASPRSKGAAMEGIGSTEAVFHLVNGILGVGVLGYPFAFKECGALLGSVIIFCILLICLFSIQLLLISSQLSGKKTFEDLAAYAFGKTGQRAVRFSILILNLGAMVAYLNVIADVLSSVAGTVVPPGAEPSRNSVIIAVTLFGILPMALFIQDASSMACVSTFTVGFIFLFAFLVLIWGLTPSPSAGKIVMWNSKGILVAFPVMAYGFTIHTILFPVYALLRAPSSKKMSQAVSQAMLVCCLVYMAVGFGGYMAYGQRISGDILRSLGSLELVGMRGVYERMLKVGYGLNILGTVPLVILPTHSLLVPMTSHFFGGRDGKSCGLETHKRLISCCIVGLSCGLAMILPNVGFILGLNGATTGVLLAYIMPSLIYLKVTNMSHGSQSKLADRTSSQWIWRRRKAVLLLLFGVSAGAICTTATLRAVHEENEVVQLAQELVERGKNVEEASAVEKKAKDVSITVDVVHNATANLGGVQGDAAASLQAIQDTAAVLNATISTEEERKPVAVWDVAKKFEQHHQEREERKTLDGVIDNLNAVRAHLRGTLVTLSGIKDDLDAGLEQIKSHNDTKVDGSAEDDLVGKQIGDIVEELKTALGVSIKTNEGETSSEATLTQLKAEVQGAMVAIKETLKILTEVEEVIAAAKERGAGDAQLKKEAVGAMYRAVNATASSALALQMTNEALHQAATNQTSEVLDVLSTVVTDRKENPTKTWAFQEALLQTKEEKDAILQFGAAEEELLEADQTEDMGVSKNSDRDDDDGKEQAEAVIQQISGIKNKAEGVDNVESDPNTLSTLAEAAKAAVNITEGSKKHAIKHQQAAVDTVDPEVAAKAEEIVAQLESKPVNGTDDSDQHKKKFTKNPRPKQRQRKQGSNQKPRKRNRANSRRQGGSWNTSFRKFF